MDINNNIVTQIREKYTVRLSVNRAVLFFPLPSEICVREHRARGACISVRATTQIKRLNVCVTNNSGACGEALDTTANESFVESFVGSSDYTGRRRFLHPWVVGFGV